MTPIRISYGGYNYHHTQVMALINALRANGYDVNMPRSFFCTSVCEYVVYIVQTSYLEGGVLTGRVISRGDSDISLWQAIKQAVDTMKAKDK